MHISLYIYRYTYILHILLILYAIYYEKHAPKPEFRALFARAPLVPLAPDRAAATATAACECVHVGVQVYMYMYMYMYIVQLHSAHTKI